jgi:hypothetical protein
MDARAEGFATICLVYSRFHSFLEMSMLSAFLALARERHLHHKFPERHNGGLGWLWGCQNHLSLRMSDRTSF